MRLSSEEYQKWVDSLKVGDLVGIVRYGLSGRAIKFKRIKSITEKRRDINIDDVVFARDGTCKSSASWSGKPHLEPVTDDLLEEKSRTILRDIVVMNMETIEGTGRKLSSNSPDYKELAVMTIRWLEILTINGVTSVNDPFERAKKSMEYHDKLRKELQDEVD